MSRNNPFVITPQDRAERRDPTRAPVQVIARGNYNTGGMSLGNGSLGRGRGSGRGQLPHGQPVEHASGGGGGGGKCILPRVQPNTDQLDTHELLKQEIGRQDEAQYMGFGGSDELSFASNSLASVNAGPATVVSNNHGFEWVELYFDSVYRNAITNLANGEISWSINTLNNSQGIASIIGIVMEPFFFPKVNVDPSLPDFFYYRRVFIEIVGTGSQQSILGPNGQRFHFECTVSNANGQAVLLTPTRPTFYFTQPLIEMTTFQLRFTIPKTDIFTTTPKPVPIPNAIVDIISLTTGGFGYNPIRFAITTPGLTTSVLELPGVIAVPGVAVFITDYASGNTTINGVINNPSGVFVTNIIDATTFEIGGIDATTVAGGFTARMFVAKNRVAMAVRFLSVVTKITNHINIADVSS